MRPAHSHPLILVTLLSFALAACATSNDDLDVDMSTGIPRERVTHKLGEPQQVPGAPRGGVNAFLWRAAMDTVGFMPLTASNPQVGRIETDWYSAPGATDERSRLTVDILSPALRRDALRVRVARQTRVDGSWRDAPVTASVARHLEDTILTRARDSRW